MPTYGLGATGADKKLDVVAFERPALGTGEVAFKVTHCGICHSDLHQARNDWKNTIYPCVPGHEIVGKVTDVGEGVTSFKKGDQVGVGCMIDSCGQCPACEAGDEQYCSGPESCTLTYNGTKGGNDRNTYGGYSTDMIVNEKFVLRIPESMDPAVAGPIMCAGITVYSPMKHWDLKEGDRLGVAGIGGLGHMAIKIGKVLGAHVTAFTRDEKERQSILDQGADEVVISTDSDAMKKAAQSIDMLIDTIPVEHDIAPYIALMAPNGNLISVGNMISFPEFSPGPLVFNRISLAGSLIGGIADTQEVLNLCAEHGISPSTRMVNADDVNDVFDTLADGGDDVFRHVIDMDSLRNHDGANDKAQCIDAPTR